MFQFQFDNRFANDLPGDAITDNYRRQVDNALWSTASPTPTSAPTLIAVSTELATELDITPEQIASPQFTEVFSGNRLLDGMHPIATRYGGHQFGHWAGQLGDGRAISLGEIIASNQQRYELQLKGAGATPYSRSADGKAVLRSSLREFLCSEAMHGLGVPTTRALSLALTGDQVIRDILYDGNARPEPGAVVCRVAPSFTRFGHFELPAVKGEKQLLLQLIEFTINRDFPHIAGENPIEQWFSEVCQRSAALAAHWMAVGFVHGVLNTDNMSILGLTIDYGPYGWVENFELNWTPNTTDAQNRRYRFGNQSNIVQWNLQCLGGAIAQVVDDHQFILDAINRYQQDYEAALHKLYAKKLGFSDWQDGDKTILAELFTLLQQTQLDMTLFFRNLSQLNIDKPTAGTFAMAEYQRGSASDKIWLPWLQKYCQRVKSQSLTNAQRITSMNSANPCYVLRNYLAQEAIDLAEQGDYSRIQTLLNLLRKPYKERSEFEHFKQKRPDWALNKVGCSQLSCSS